MVDRYFSDKTMTFLRKLARNNNRDWFEKNKAEYEETVRTPALQFIADMSDGLADLSPHFLAVPKKVGGSLMRVHRDIRFGKDKRPYKTNIGIQFRHERGKDVHAPGFYVHVERGGCFVGVGIWRPDSPSLGKIRDVIAQYPDKWNTAIADRAFRKHFQLRGDSLARPPRGYDKEHPLIEDLKRKDFIAFSEIADAHITGKGFRKKTLQLFNNADDYMQFLCKALELQY